LSDRWEVLPPARRNGRGGGHADPRHVHQDVRVAEAAFHVRHRRDHLTRYPQVHGYVLGDAAHLLDPVPGLVRPRPVEVQQRHGEAIAGQPQGGRPPDA
jgi:hypothetical protein